MSSVFVDTHSDVSMPDETIQLHSHGFYEIMFCRSGSLRYLLGVDRYSIQHGDIVYIPPGASHQPLRFENHEEAYVRYVLWVSERFVTAIKDNFGEDIVPSAPFVLRTANTPMEDFFAKYFGRGVNEAKFQESGWQAVVSANTVELFVHIMRERKGETSLHPGTDVMGKLDKIMVYIENHLAEDIRISDIGQMMALSESSIDKLFRSQLKTSFHRYLTQRRLIAAKTFLKGNIPAEQVSEQTGFSDYSTFYRAFKKNFGLSPTEFKRLQD